MAEADQPPDQPPLPARVTTPLLTLITMQSLDEGYRHVAEQRRAQRLSAASGEQPADNGEPTRPSRLLTGVAVTVFGLLVALAAVQTSRNAEVDDASHNTLVARVQSERETLESLQDRIVDLREGNAEVQRQLTQLVSIEQSAVARLRRLQVATGFIATRGDGIVITVDDPASGDPQQAVRADNLSWLVDGLWLAGAEAISINDQRLTAVSAITQSQVAINVNTVPQRPPYVVRAIGDQATLQGRLLETGPGALFFDAAATFGFRVTVDNGDAMTLPAAPDRLARLREVEPLAGRRDGPGSKEEMP